MTPNRPVSRSRMTLEALDPNGAPFFVSNQTLTASPPTPAGSAWPKN